MDKPAYDDTCITYFVPHPEEMVDKTVKAVSSTSPSIFGNFLNRIFKSAKDISITGNEDWTATSISSSESSKNSDQSKHDEVGEASNISASKTFYFDKHYHV